MNHKDDEKILMIYLNEADQQDIDDCLASPELCEQLDQLEADMNAIEQAQSQPQLPDDYGQQLWNKITDKLEVQATNNSELSQPGWLEKLKNWLLQPQYSLASFTAVLALVMVAFFIGKQQQNEGFDYQMRDQLLAQNLQLHLAQSEIFLTQVSNGNGSARNQRTAQRLLSSNRIFKQALTQHQGQFTYQLLNDLEPLFLEYANGAPTYNQTGSSQQPRASWVNQTDSNDLMIQIKAMKQQLATENDII
jgi:hypothetical protein